MEEMAFTAECGALAHACAWASVGEWDNALLLGLLLADIDIDVSLSVLIVACAPACCHRYEFPSLIATDLTPPRRRRQLPPHAVAEVQRRCCQSVHVPVGIWPLHSG